MLQLESVSVTLAAVRKKIAFFRQGNFSHINEHVAAQLREKFPEYELEEIDVLQDLVKPAKLVVLRNCLHTLSRYIWQIGTGSRDARDCFFHTLYFFRAVRRLVARRFGPLAHEYAFSFQTQSLFDASIEGVPHFVYTDHTHLANTYYPGFHLARLFPLKWVGLERNIYRRADKTFVMSNHVRHSLIEHYGHPAARVALVRAGSNLGEPPLPPVRDNYRSQRILFVGIEWERKGGPQLLEAFSLARKVMPDAKLVVAGCSLRVHEENVEILGRIPLAEVSDQLRQATLLALPSLVEPFGIIALEAGLHKIPVIASSIGGLTDIISDGENGLLVPPDEVPPLADAIVRLLRDPEMCRAFGERGYQVVKERYTWPLVGARLREEISAVLKPPM